MELAEKLKNIKINSDVSVYNHVNKIIQKMIENGEENPYGKFEKYSEFFTRKNSKNGDQKQNYIQDNSEEIKKEITELRKFLKIEQVLKKKKTEEEEEEEEENEEEVEAVNLGEIRNLKIEEITSRQCGITIGEEETYYLEKSIEYFIKSSGATKVDFWGKIYTSSSDYFVLKVKVEPKDEEEEKEITEDHEIEGTGINTNIFYVSKNLLDNKSWCKLPLITSNQMRQARKMKYIFSGDLEKKIVSSPTFDGLEKHLLKAQIVRIDNSTCLMPKGEYLIKKEDEEEIDLSNFVEIEKEEEPKKKDLNFFWDLENWTHFSSNILKQGRLVHQELKYPEDDETEDEEREKIKKYAVSLDPYEERLKSITKDKCEGLDKCWDFKFFGNKNITTHPFLNKNISETVFMIKSFVWPGFYLFCKDGYFFTRYFGYGSKYTKEEYFPKYEYFLQTEEEFEPLSKEITKPIPEEENAEEENKDEG